MEKFQQGDFVKLKDPTKAKDITNGINIFVFHSQEPYRIRLSCYSPCAINFENIITEKDKKDDQLCLGELFFFCNDTNVEPIPFTQEATRHIYLDHPLLAGLPDRDTGKLPIGTMKFSSLWSDVTRQSLGIEEPWEEFVHHENIRYVHELQHWLRDNFSFSRCLLAVDYNRIAE